MTLHPPLADAAEDRAGECVGSPGLVRLVLVWSSPAGGQDVLSAAEDVIGEDGRLADLVEVDRRS